MATNNAPVVMGKGELKQWFDKNTPAMAALWGNVEDAKRMYLSFINAANKNPKILECTKETIQQSLMEACEMRLYPGLQECAMVPYWNGKKKCMELQFQPQYQGLVKLAMNTRVVKTVDAEVVYDNDVFDWEKGSNAHLTWKRAKGARGNRYAVWAMFTLEDGEERFVVMYEEDVAKIKARSKNADSEHSPWNTDTDAMWKKTAVKQVLKLAPKSFQLAQAIEKDNAIESGEIDLPVAGSEAVELKDKVQAAKQKTQAPAATAQQQAPQSAPPTEEPVQDAEYEEVPEAAAEDEVETDEHGVVVEKGQDAAPAPAASAELVKVHYRYNAADKAWQTLCPHLGMSKWEDFTDSKTETADAERQMRDFAQRNLGHDNFTLVREASVQAAPPAAKKPAAKKTAPATPAPAQAPAAPPAANGTAAPSAQPGRNFDDIKARAAAMKAKATKGPEQQNVC